MVVPFLLVVERRIGREHAIGRRDEKGSRGREQTVGDLSVDTLIGIEGVHLADDHRHSIVLAHIEGVIRLEHRSLIVDVGDVQLERHRTAQTRLTEIASTQFDLIGRERFPVECSRGFHCVFIGTNHFQVEPSARLDRQLCLNEE